MTQKTSIFIAGSGRVGTLIGLLLAETGDYNVCLADRQPPLLNHSLQTIKLDITDKKALLHFLKKFNPTALFSCLPYYHNIHIAEIAREMSLHYFDLTEDRNSIHVIKKTALNQKTAFVPACGTAPGFVNIVAHHLAKKFETIDNIELRVGSLPVAGEKSLQYALTWSTEGLINQYANLCSTIINGESTEVSPLKDKEALTLDGTAYEAFNTSGGIGTLVETYTGKVKNLNYKTIRYPGHCEKMDFLMNELQLGQDRSTLKRILEHALPETHQDMTIIYVSVDGQKKGHFIRETYLKKFYAHVLFKEKRASIQITTASSACAILDLVLNTANKYQGFVLQEDFNLSDFYKNRFGKMFIAGRYMDVPWSGCQASPHFPALKTPD